MPGQTMRRKNVHRKLNAMALEFAGKNVLLVDDSLYEAQHQAKLFKWHAMLEQRKCTLHRLHQPLDMPMYTLVAYNRNDAQIAEAIGADYVIFQALPDLISACNKFNPALEHFDTSVFDGKYVTGDVSTEYLRMLDSTRNDEEKTKRDADAPETIGLHNNFGK
ncbi:phosphoribosyltransferase-like protein [Syncephalis fuscata]|nr:phosphoribosyltransferase-like protein [Syncephalis fuscata]